MHEYPSEGTFRYVSKESEWSRAEPRRQNRSFSSLVALHACFVFIFAYDIFFIEIFGKSKKSKLFFFSVGQVWVPSAVFLQYMSRLCHHTATHV